MKRGLTLASVLVAIYLVVSVAPVTSLQASGTLVVGSQHTTTTDFNNAETLTNVSVSGDAVHYTGPEPVDSYEDGDLSEYAGELSVASVVSASLDGSQAVRLSHSDSNPHNIISTGGLPTYPAAGDTISATLKPETDVRTSFLFGVQDSDSYYQLTVNVQNDAIELWVNDDGTYTQLDEDNLNLGTLNAGTVYDTTIEWDENGQITATVSEGGTTVGTVTGTDSRFSSGGIGLRSNSGDTNQDSVLWDGIVIGQNVDSGRYVSASHTVEGAEDAAVNLELTDADATVEIQGWTGSSWTTVASNTYTTSGNKTLDISGTGYEQWRTSVEFQQTGNSPSGTLFDESILFTNHAPAIDSASASPQNGSEVSNQDVTLSIDIGDQEFGTAQGETVDVTFYNAGDDGEIGGGDDSVIGTDTLTANGTATTSWTAQAERTWYVTAEDSYGSQETSSTFSFKAPGALYLRNETNVSQLVNTSGVSSIKFYTDPSDSNAKIYDRPVENGKVNLTGLPSGTPFVATIDVDGYYPRQIYISSIFEQSSVFLLNTSEPAVENIFIIDDRTGMYPPGDSVVVLQKGVNRSQYSSGGSGLQWTTIAGDRLGADNQYVGTLRQNDRYRILIENQRGDQRVLGEYPANLNGTVQLEVGNLKFDFGDENQTYQWDANYINISGTEYVTFNYSDPTEETTDLTVEIYEQGNESHTLAPAQTFTGPLGNRSIMEPVPASENETTWVVSWEATRNGEPISGQHTVGSQIREQIVELDDWIQNAVAILFIILTGALGSQLNKETIAIATALVSGGFWYAGWLPAEAGAAVIIALFIAVFYKSAKSGGSFT